MSCFPIQDECADQGTVCTPSARRLSHHAGIKLPVADYFSPAATGNPQSGDPTGFAPLRLRNSQQGIAPDQKPFPAARTTTSGGLFQQGLLAQLRQRGLDLLERRLQSRTPVRIRRSCRQDLLPLQLQFLPRALFLPVDARSSVHRSGPLRLLFFDRLRLPTL